MWSRELFRQLGEILYKSELKPSRAPVLSLGIVFLFNRTKYSLRNR